MNATLWFLLGELVFVSLVIAILMAVVRWRKRKRLITELQALLAKVHVSEPGRQEGLQGRLVKSFGLEVNEAEILSVEIIQSERKLFKGFAEILFGGEIEKLSVFDTTVYTVLDNYWELLAIEAASENTGATQSEESEQISIEDSVVGSDDISVDSEEIAIDSEEIAIESGIEELSDKTESGPGATALITEEIDPDEVIDISEEAGDLGEPSWDDAFAEASDSGEATDSIEEQLTSPRTEKSELVVDEKGNEVPAEPEAENS